MSAVFGVKSDAAASASALPALTVKVEKDLEDLVQRFLARKRDDLKRARAALAARQFDVIRHIGHNLKGAGEAFGFPELSAFGAALESAAVAHNERALGEQLALVEQFLSRLRITLEK
jgi:histidine phosphotransfer protein HptB